MTKLYHPPRGMHDVLHDQFALHSRVIQVAYDLACLYEYKNISLPIVEHADVFHQVLGDETDILKKEIYCFNDKKGRKLALRPEFTASIMRSVLSNKMYDKLPLKFFTYGPLFRYDRPQQARQRQFSQINFENIGDNLPSSDAETIILANNILQRLNIKNYTIKLNSLGCTETRLVYEKELIQYFHKNKTSLSKESALIIDKNPLRILDSKREEDIAIVQNAPAINNFYTDVSRKHFDAVLQYMNYMDVPYEVDTKLVRGLDYYCHSVFEFITDQLGAQSTILAGGRYEGIFKKFSGKNDLPAIGFAGGVERIASLLKFKNHLNSSVAILPLSLANMNFSLSVAEKVRSLDIPVQVDNFLEKKCSTRLTNLIKLDYKIILFIGSEEEEKNSCRMRIIPTKYEEMIDVNELELKIMSFYNQITHDHNN